VKNRRQWLVQFADVALACPDETSSRRVRRCVKYAWERGCHNSDVLLRIAKLARELVGVDARKIVDDALRGGVAL